MGRDRNIKVVLNREEVERLLEDLERETTRAIQQAEDDARLLSRLHTNYGRRRSRTDTTILPGAFRRVRNLLRGI